MKINTYKLLKFLIQIWSGGNEKDPVCRANNAVRLCILAFLTSFLIRENRILEKWPITLYE